MRESRMYGSERGAPGNRRPYRDESLRFDVALQFPIRLSIRFWLTARSCPAPDQNRMMSAGTVELDC